MKKLVLIFALLVMAFTGCSGKSAKNEDRTDMDFTVVPREDMPDEIKGINSNIGRAIRCSIRAYGFHWNEI